MVLAQPLRLRLSDGRHDRVGRLFALADKRLRAAINAMHECHTIAERAAMSRAAIALKFKEVIGLSCMDCLPRWRVMLAYGQADQFPWLYFADRVGGRL
jgi:transcriptional regulator GlxA family with amidase domain